MELDKPSNTAIAVCVSHYVLQTHEPFKGLMAKDQAAIATQVIRHFKPFVFSLIDGLRKFRPFTLLLRRIQARFATPGLSTYLIVRKKTIHDLVEDIITKEGKVQVVALAAGFDTLTYRLALKYPQLHFFETDHPATQVTKVRMYQELGYSAKNNHILPCDFTVTNVETVLQENPAFDPTVKTIFLAEGLMMYLPHDLFMKMLGTMKSLIKNKSFMIFSYLQVRPQTGKPGFLNQSKFMDKYLEKSSEPFMWGRSQAEQRRDLTAAGFNVEEDFDHVALRARYNIPDSIPFAQGENICMISH